MASKRPPSNKPASPVITRFQPGKSGNPAGKPKGTPNRLTVLAKDAIALAAEGLGGTERLISWAQEDPANERAFWASIYPKLLPLTVTGDPNAPLELRTTLTLVRPPPRGD